MGLLICQEVCVASSQERYQKGSRSDVTAFSELDT